MNKRFLKIETQKDVYGQGEVKTLTVGKLKNLLEDYDEEIPIILSFDGDYTFGGLSYSKIFEDSYSEDKEDEYND